MKKGIQKYAVIALIVLFFGFFLGTLSHELIGHGLTAVLFGGEVTKVCVIFVEADSGGLSLNYCESAYGSFGYSNWNLQVIPLNYGFVILMGSVLTFVISLIFSFVLLFKKKLKFYSKCIFSVMALYFIDILFFYFYSFVSSTADFARILEDLDISIVPLFQVIALGAFTTMTILFYKLRDKEIKSDLKLILYSLLFLTLVSLAVFMVYFGFEIHRIWR